MRKNKYSTLVIIAFVLTVLTGIFLPGILLRYTSLSELEKVSSVPKEYYLASNSAISKTASYQLSEYEKIKLISGVWESTQKKVSTDKSKDSPGQAVILAKEALHKLYQNKLFPYNLDSAYQNWYYWEAELYQCTETTFHTYTAYYWHITFEKYDSSETHEVIMTEQGTLLNISSNTPIVLTNEDLSDWNRHLENSLSHNENLNSYSLLRLNKPANLPAYENATLSQDSFLSGYVLIKGNPNILSWTQFKELTADTLSTDTELYNIYLSSNGMKSQITFIPWE